MGETAGMEGRPWSSVTPVGHRRTRSADWSAHVFARNVAENLKRSQFTKVTSELAHEGMMDAWEIVETFDVLDVLELVRPASRPGSRVPDSRPGSRLASPHQSPVGIPRPGSRPMPWDGSPRPSSRPGISRPGSRAGFDLDVDEDVELESPFDDCESVYV